MAVRTLSPLGVTWLGDIPAQFRADPDIKGAMDVMARETQRIYDRMDAITNGYFPTLDVAGNYLSIWEKLLLLSVNPGGYTTAARQARDIASLQSLGSGSTGTAFEAAARAIVGPNFKYREHMAVGDLPTNLLVNPSFETNLTGWSNGINFYVQSGATLTQDATTFQFGTKSMKVVTAATTLHGAGAAVAAPPDGGIFRAGTTYRFSVYLKGNAGGEQVSVAFGWDGGNTDRGLQNITLTNAWARYTVDWTPTTDRTTAVVAIANQNATVNTYFVDGAMAVNVAKLAMISPLPAYFDGSISGYEWTGTANASTSRLINVPDNTIRVDLGVAATSQQATDLYNLLRAILPAHIALSINYGIGFVVGVSHVGVDAL